MSYTKRARPEYYTVMTGMSLLVAMEVYVIGFYHHPFGEMSLVSGLPLLLNILILLVNFSCQVGLLTLARYFKNPFVEAGTCSQLAFAISMFMNDVNRIWFWIVEISSLYFVFIIIKNALTLKRKLDKDTFENAVIGSST